MEEETKLKDAQAQHRTVHTTWERSEWNAWCEKFVHMGAGWEGRAECLYNR